jgi:hypothetical protein
LVNLNGTGELGVAANPNHSSGHDNPILPDADMFKLVSETHKQITEVAAMAREAIEAFYTDPVLLTAFIEQHGTPVYVCSTLSLSNLCLRLLGFDPGFIPPSGDRRYRLLCRFLSIQSRFHLKRKQGEKANCHAKHGVFVLTRPLFTIGFISHQLHHWLAARSGMQGYCDLSQRLYREFWNKSGRLGPEVLKMKPEEILALKAAINRDLEALQFLKEIANEVLIPAKQARRISAGKASA